MFRITYKKQARKYLQKIPARNANKFYDAFDQIADDKEKGLNIVDYKGMSNGHRLRIGNYRAIYTKIEEELTIEVIKVGARGDIYK